MRPYESVRHPPLRIRSFRIESTEPAALGMFVFTHNTQRCRRAYPGLFSPTLHTLIGLQVHCTGFQPFAPWPTHRPIFAAVRRGPGARLRLAISPFALSCGDLGLQSSTAASFYAGGKTRHVPRLRQAMSQRRCPSADAPAPQSVLDSHCGIQSRAVPTSSRKSGLSPRASV